MAKIERVGEVSEKSASEIYEAGIIAFEVIGFEVWKKRPLGWLCLAKKIVEDVEVDANLAARPTAPASYALTINAESISQQTLNEIADSFLIAFNKALGG